MALSRADLLVLERALLIVRRELANDNRSGSPSSMESGALVQGDQCDEKEESEFMDPTNTEGGGVSSSPELTASRLLSRSRQRTKHNVLPMRPAHNRKAER